MESNDALQGYRQCMPAPRLRRKLSGQTIVLTGASSGIGLVTARAAAASGANLVLAARGPRALRQVATQLRARGARVTAVPTDVADPAAVETLAEVAAAEHGRIDVWVNNAAVSVYGTVDQISAQEFDQVTRVTYLGVVHGCKAVLPRMRAQGRGVVVNVASALGVRAVPLQAPYVAAKHAVVGFTDALRMELAREGRGVRVGLVLPAGTDTPFYDRARSYLGVRPSAPPPVYAPEVVAEAILDCAVAPRSRLFAGGAGRGFDLVQRLSTPLTDRILAGPYRVFDRQLSRAAVDGPDNLDAPVDGDPRERSGRLSPVLRTSPWTRWAEQLLPPDA